MEDAMNARDTFADMFMFIAGGASMNALLAWNQARGIQMTQMVNGPITWLVGCLLLIGLAQIWRRYG